MYQRCINPRCTGLCCPVRAMSTRPHIVPARWHNLTRSGTDRNSLISPFFGFASRGSWVRFPSSPPRESFEIVASEPEIWRSVPSSCHGGPLLWQARRSLMEAPSAAGLIVPGHAGCSAMYHLPSSRRSVASCFGRIGRSHRTPAARSPTWSTPGIDDVEFVETLEVLEVSGHDGHVVNQGGRADESIAERCGIRYVQARPRDAPRARPPGALDS
jgi:hypothetical protein